MATILSPTSDIHVRVAQLEKQVQGLMATVIAMHEKMRLGSWKVPRPDELLQVSQDSTAEQKGTAKSGQRTATSKIAPSSTTQPKITPGALARVSPDLTALQPFQYSPLDAGSSEVRLIKILDSTAPDEPITCELIVKALPDTPYLKNFPYFMPLSYTWGGLAKTETIVINGKSLLVTKNLHVALKHFRNAGSRSTLPPAYARGNKHTFHWWIDAISINQSDLDERKSQVALMTRLYRLAPVAHVWLGEEAEDSAHAIEIVKSLSHRSTEKEQNEFVEQKPGQTHRFKGPGTLPERIPDEPAQLPENDKARNYQALVQLFKREWFSRVWILQEMALPSQVSVHCGDQVCTWDQLMRATSLLVYLIDEYQLPALQHPNLAEKGSIASIFQRAELLSRLRNAIQSRQASRSPYLSLTSALLYAKNSLATDPRDKVYAILPLVSPEITPLSADYRQSRVEVYKTTALGLASVSLDFLSMCQYNEGASSDLPSWVPDFSLPWKFYPMLATLPPRDGDDPKAEYTAVSIPQDAALKVQGFILNTLSIVVDPGVTASSSKAEVQTAKKTWEAFVAKNDVDRKVANLNDQLRYYSSGNAMYWPLYKPAYVGGKGEHFDLSIRAFNRQLTPNADDVELHHGQSLGWYRNFLAGRRFASTREGHAGIVPAAAKLGDKVCKLHGSEIMFILRESGNKQWLVIGDSCKTVSWDVVAPVPDRYARLTCLL